MLEQHRKGSLALYLKEYPNISLKEAAELTDAILTGLEIYHQQQGLHLRLCPGSVLLTGEGVKLVSTGQEDFRKMLWYTAPEIRTGNLSAVGCETDLYGVCAIFFRMAMGRPLREGEVIGTCLMPTLSAMPIWAPKAPPSAAQQTAKILKKGLHTLPKKRYQTTAQLREDLNRLRELLETNHST